MSPSTIALASVLALLVPAGAVAAWGPRPVLVDPNIAISGLESAPDGANGAYLLWQESPGGGAGRLMLQHLQSQGDLDPAWPASGVEVCAVVASRAAAGVSSDAQGACLAWWIEGTQLFARRILADGTGDSRWPARGLLFGDGVLTARGVTADGAGGFYAAYNLSTNRIRVVHCGEDGQPAPGWPAQGRVLSQLLLYSLRPAIANSEDGGVYVAWLGVSGDTLVAPHGYYAVRLLANASSAPGWDEPGVLVAELSSAFLVSSLNQLYVSASADGSGGVLACTVEREEFADATRLRLRRLAADGQFVPGWGPEAAGEPPYDGVFPTHVSDARVMPLPDDGALVTLAGFFYTDSPLNAAVYRFDASGAVAASWLLGFANQYDFCLDPAGGYHALLTVPCWSPGWIGLGHDVPDFSALSSPSLDEGCTVSFRFGGPDLPYACNFSPSTITPAGEGKAIATWVSRYDETGLVAALIGGPPLVTSVGPGAPGTAPLTATFVPARGIVASIAAGAFANGRLALFDVAGRLVASLASGPAGDAHVLPGTRALAPGLYLLRCTDGAETAFAKVAVLR